MPGEAFEVMLTEPGVYDYYCVPHEHAGMVGRIVVGAAPARRWPRLAGGRPAGGGAGGVPAGRGDLRQGVVRRGLLK